MTAPAQTIKRIKDYVAAPFQKLAAARRAFLDATYIKPHDKWPVRAFKRTLFLASAITVPTTLKKAVVAFVTYAVIHPLTLMLFPSAASVLREKGLDPKLVEQLAPGQNVHVRKDNLAGKVHTFFDAPAILFYAASYSMIFNDNARAYARGEKILLQDIGLHSVYIKDSKSQKQPSRLTPEQQDKLIFLHELAHCGQNPKQLPTQFQREMHADVAALSALANDPDIRLYLDDLIQKRSYTSILDDTYGDALYLDALRLQQEPPSIHEMQAANRDAKPFIDFYYTSEKMRLQGQTLPKDYADNLALYHEKKMELPYLAYRRVILAEEALRQVQELGHSAKETTKKKQQTTKKRDF